MSVHTAPLAAIAIGERDREEMGDIAGLAESITAVGLLHPVVVTEALTLVAGGRRLEAAKHLGWTTVPVTVVNLANVADVLRAEADENTARKPLTPYEASRARERRARVLAEDAAKRQAHGKTAPGKAMDASANLAEASEGLVEDGSAEPAPVPPKPKPTDRETRKAAALGTGYSGSTLDKVDKIRSVAERGVIPIGQGKQRQEIPAPEPVRDVAQRGLSQVKQTGFAIEPRVQELDRAIEKFVEADPDVQATRYVKRFIDALSQVHKVYADFDPEEVASLVEVTTAEQLERHAAGLRAFADKVNRARSGLRLIEGGRG